VLQDSLLQDSLPSQLLLRRPELRLRCRSFLRLCEHRLRRKRLCRCLRPELRLQIV
jgi:hypothetical protein